MDTVYSSQKFFYLPPSPHVDYKPSKRRGPFKPLPCCLKQRLAHSEFLITTYYKKIIQHDSHLCTFKKRDAQKHT